MINLPLRSFGLILLTLLLLISACSSDDSDPVGPSETRVPEQITDLQVISGSSGEITLSWTAPYLQVKSNAVIAYELKYISLENVGIDITGWTDADAPGNDASGDAHTHTISNLDIDQVYAFALRAHTESLPSSWSNITVGTAANDFDTTAPAQVQDVQWWSSTPTSMTITWQATGDDGVYGTADAYEVRYSLEPIDDENWLDASVSSAAIETASNVRRWETTIAALTEGQEYYFAVQAADNSDLVSPVSENLSAIPEQRQTWYVKVDHTGDAPTIEAALDSVSPGDVILVAPGHYTWSNQGTGGFYGLIFIYNWLSDFELRSEGGAAVTILDAEENGNVIWVFGYNENLIIDGFTITGGRIADHSEESDAYAGGGIVVHLASPIIRNCVITGNYAPEGGGIWMGSTCQPRLENCIIENNSAQRGGGVCCINDAQRMIIDGCLIRNNHAYLAGGGFFDYNALFTMQNCVVTGNTSDGKGGGISLTTLHPDSWLINTTIVDNTGLWGGGIRITNYCSINMDACVVAYNQGTAFSTQTSGGIAMGCSDVYGNTTGNGYPLIFTDLGNNFNVDPMFCNTATGTLLPNSPCLPGNHPSGGDCGLIGAAEQGNCP